MPKKTESMTREEEQKSILDFCFAVVAGLEAKGFVFKIKDEVNVHGDHHFKLESDLLTLEMVSFSFFEKQVKPNLSIRFKPFPLAGATLGRSLQLMKEKLLPPEPINAKRVQEADLEKWINAIARIFEGWKHIREASEGFDAAIDRQINWFVEAVVKKYCGV